MKEYEIKANNRYVRFFGRTAPDVLDGLTFFNWSCSGFEFSFYGKGAAARIFTGKWRDGKVAGEDSRAYLGVWLDDSPEKHAVIALDEEEKLVTLADGLENGQHKVKVMKLTEAGYGRAALRSILIEGTGKPEPTRAKSVRMEFIGDSITCGYGNICPDGSPLFVTREEDASQTFAWFLAEKMKSEISCVCASGNGVFHDYGMNTVNLIPELYKYTDKMLSGHYGKTPSEWDSSSYIPDYVVIKLGQNDSRFCMGMDLDESDRIPEVIKSREEQFRDRYIEFLIQVRSANPHSKIIVFYDSDTHLKERIRQAVAFCQSKNGDDNIFVTGVMSKLPSEGVGANGHWAVATHKRVAHDLYYYILLT
ncbi:MAG: GDSL-type esterase/lipase family protein [Eubacteriales bacterium]|nr:GDSL-type esterase/lipase family protein [Eubacteriales bacterium]MDD4327828.1 GDSL-type esterase/lipase family protein [Eubacteriales bacterium]MDD4717204.1 GDSL-type esterase/lipase family protein [Eubacteriales bacterium]